MREIMYGATTQENNVIMWLHFFIVCLALASSSFPSRSLGALLSQFSLPLLLLFFFPVVHSYLTLIVSLSLQLPDEAVLSPPPLAQEESAPRYPNSSQPSSSWARLHRGVPTAIVAKGGRGHENRVAKKMKKEEFFFPSDWQHLKDVVLSISFFLALLSIPLSVWLLVCLSRKHILSHRPLHFTFGSLGKMLVMELVWPVSRSFMRTVDSTSSAGCSSIGLMPTPK